MTYDVTLTIQYPSIAETNGVTYYGISASSRAEAIKVAKRIDARRFPTQTGSGKKTWKAVPQNV